MVHNVSVKTFFRGQKETAAAINKIIDGYWANNISEANMIRLIKDILENNSRILFRDGDFATTIRQRCGKCRLGVVKRIKNMD